MNRQEFRQVAQEFCTWAGKFSCDADGHLTPIGRGALATLPISLAIPRSAKVSAAIHQRVPFSQLTRTYSWRAEGVPGGSFAETQIKLECLSKAITAASNDIEALEVCERILQWGGDRNSNVGALKFLRSQASVLDYLNAVKTDLALQTAIVHTSGGLPAVLAMNSMLTKVHALKSGDGLPIYDSRVAGAIATLVETWRTATGCVREPLPDALMFPEVGGGGARRSVRARYPSSIRPTQLYYPVANQAPERALKTAKAWASAKVRLGWLLAELLVEPCPSGIRSLEACLFMAGYNCAGINK